MRILFAGTPAVALPAFETLLASSHDVLAVVTRPDAAAGRGRVATGSPVARRAGEAGVEVLKPSKPADPQFQERLRALAPDCVAVVAYGALIPPSALEIPRLGWVNLHFSLLPAWRGAAPVQHAILHGDDITGATTFEIEAALDTGPVLGMLTEEIPFYGVRHTVRPGITGWAQVQYKYGNTLEDAREKLQYDLFYIKNASVGLDFWIVFQTIKIVLLGRGAK